MDVGVLGSRREVNKGAEKPWGGFSTPTDIMTIIRDLICSGFEALSFALHPHKVNSESPQILQGLFPILFI